MSDTYVYVGEKMIKDGRYLRTMNIYKTINEHRFTAYIEGSENNNRFLENSDVVFLSEEVFNKLAVVRSQSPVETEFGLSDETVEVLRNAYLEYQSKRVVENEAKALSKN